MYKLSRYVVTGKEQYRNDRGDVFDLAWGLRKAQFVPIESTVMEDIRDGHFDRVSPITLNALKDLRIVVPQEEDERESVLQENESVTGDTSQLQISLLPTSYCNMSCTYCGQEHKRGGLTANHRDRVRARVLRQMRQDATKFTRIDWFGAEPMIGYPMILDLSKDFIREAEERDLGYAAYLVTNGSLLTPEKIRTLAKECRVVHFEITVDGPPEIHNVHRPMKNKKGTFWKIIRAVQEVMLDDDMQSVNFAFRTNVDIENKDHISRYIDLMASEGFARPNVIFSIQPVHAWGNDVSDLELEKQQMADHEVSWLRLLESHGMTYEVLTERRKLVCPAVHAGSELISSTGNILSCTEHPLVPEAEKNANLGSIYQDDLPIFRPEGLFDRWYDAVREGDSWNEDIGKSWCTNCPFLPVCGGSCPKAWEEGNPPCPSFKYNYQTRMDIMARRSGWRPVSEEAPSAT